MGSIVAILIVTSPFVFYSYVRFPDVKVWETPFFVFESKYYESVSTFMWVFLQKFVFLYLMIIWFFTSKNWWNSAILVPISMLLYQIIILFNDEFQYKDEFITDKYVIISISIAVCLFLYYIRKKLSSYIRAIGLADNITSKINELEKELHEE